MDDEPAPIDPATQVIIDQISGAISAQKFILENLYAFVLHQGGGTRIDAEATCKEMLRQFEDLPPRFVGADPARVFPVIQHGVDHLERFWANVVARLPR